ncbi:MAG TPA: hypothetical protein VK432_06495, partial [Stellaceae bacterium]|nr:hypothetical protein [Stellaceae bacterium]
DPAAAAEIVDAINKSHRRTYVNVTYIHLGQRAGGVKRSGIIFRTDTLLDLARVTVDGSFRYES